MSSKIKVLYITKYNQKEISEKPDNFTYYIKSIMNSNLTDVHLLNPLSLQKENSIQALITLVKTIKNINPDILYLNNLQGLNKLVVLKRIGILKCKIVAWKYTYCKEYSNPIKNWCTKYFYWKGIDKIYMMFDNHTHHALTHNIVKVHQITTLSRGAEIEWYQKYLKPQKNTFLVMATGKDSRDYQTLSEACEQTQTNCHIITRRHESNIKVAEKFKNSQYIKFTFMEDLHIANEYEYIMQQQGQASILAIPCEKRKYGVGYTNVVEALPYYIPILMTHNPDIHINLEKEGIGYLIEPYDVEAWKEKIIYLKQHPEVIETMSKYAKKLTEGEYNARTTASYIMNDFIRITQ
jgi:glycosyltransferase involved in cell wall biosynthesis